MMRQPACRRRGLTLIELMVALGITALLIGAAWPSWTSYIARKRLEQSAHELASAVRLARSLHMQQRQLVVLHFSSGTGFSCFAVFQVKDMSGCTCRNWPNPTCPVRDAAHVSSQSTSFQTTILQNRDGVSVSVPSALLPDRRVLFDAVTGLPSFGSSLDAVYAELSSSEVGTLRVMINATGTASICTHSGDFSFPACASADAEEDDDDA